jgi:hypothetical protein
MKVIIGVIVVAVLAALATNWAKGKGEDILHHAIDTALPGKVEAHPWTPLQHGRPQRADRVSFQSGSLTTARCHATLGSYTVHVDHGFSFQSAGHVKAGCPGSKLRTELGKATRVDVETHGKTERLVFTDDDDHTVAKLQGKGG